MSDPDRSEGLGARPERQGRGEFLALMAAASATVAISIDAMLPAFSNVREYLELPSGSSTVALIVTVFIAGLGVGQFVYGPLADRFGRKPVFLAGLLLYIVAGFATTFATSLEGLLIGRFFWGLGAAGPRIVSQAMLRDRLRGNALARAMAIILTIFLVVPTLAPIAGQAALALGSWRFAFAIGPAFGILVMLWSFRLTESLKKSEQRPVDAHSIASSVKEVLKNRRTLGNTIALTAMNAAFLPYLASSERIYGEIYQRADQFYLWFAASSIFMAVCTLTTAQFVKRIGSYRTMLGALMLLLVAATLNAWITIEADGVPGFAVFFIATTLVISLNTSLTPLLTSGALEEVGHIAGTAASTIGTLSFVGGALLSPLVDRAIESTVTPFAVSYLIFSVAAALAAVWANRRAGIQAA